MQICFIHLYLSGRDQGKATVKGHKDTHEMKRLTEKIPSFLFHFTDKDNLKKGSMYLDASCCRTGLEKRFRLRVAEENLLKYNPSKLTEHTRLH